MNNNKLYYNYHKHTHYSNLRTLDVIVKPIDFIKRAKELGHNAYFTTEHGWGGNLWEAYTLCEQNGLKCIYGAEVYYVDDRFEKERSNYHLIMVALNRQGSRDINKVVSQANLNGYYYKPRVDLNLLLSINPKNVIITTACVGGRLFKTDDYEDKFVKPMINHFGKNFMLEVQSHNTDIQIKWNKGVLELANKYDIPIIHANDSHYIKSEDSKYRDMFLQAKGIFYEEESNFILDYPDYDTIIDRYAIQGVLTNEQAVKALNNTCVFDRCEDLNLDKDFKIPKICEGDSDKVLFDIIKKEWSVKKATIPESQHIKYSEEILKEYKTIVECGMADYFILDYEIVKRAINVYDAVLTKSGRGSAVSFLINKMLGLTEVDRLKAPTTLYPSRFMTAERILNSRSLPDIDLNFADAKPVVKASKDILGEDGIYFMIAYKPLQESSAFRLWCKAKGMHVSEYDEVAKDLESYENDTYWKSIIDDSKIFRGVIESVAPSPCSYLLSDKPISEEVGLIKVGDEMCCCLDGYQCDYWKFLKND